MRPETLQSLADAKSAAEEILSLTGGDWHTDRVRALAVERLLITVGEAFVRIRLAEPVVLERISDSLKIIGMRNVLVHGYDALEYSRIRVAIDVSIPALITEISLIVSET